MGALVKIFVVALVAAQMQPASDFAFRLEEKSCSYEIVDTFKGTYSRYAVSPVAAKLSSQQMATIFDVMVRNRLFDAADSLAKMDRDPPGDATGVVELEVRNAGKTHKLWWASTNEWRNTEMGRALIAVHVQIQRTVNEHPIVKNLPRGDGCFGRDGAGRP